MLENTYEPTYTIQNLDNIISCESLTGTNPQKPIEVTIEKEGNFVIAVNFCVKDVEVCMQDTKKYLFCITFDLKSKPSEELILLTLKICSK